MEKADLENVAQKNPQLNAHELVELHREAVRLTGGKKPRYRLATIERHRVTKVDPDVPKRRIKSLPVPGF